MVSVSVATGRRSPRDPAPIGVLTGTYGARVIGPLIDSLGRPDVRVIVVPNEFFGGNTGVTGLMVGADIARVLEGEPTGHRYFVPDVCLSEGRFSTVSPSTTCRGQSKSSRPMASLCDARWGDEP